MKYHKFIVRLLLKRRLKIYFIFILSSFLMSQIKRLRLKKTLIEFSSELRTLEICQIFSTIFYKKIMNSIWLHSLYHLYQLIFSLNDDLICRSLINDLCLTKCIKIVNVTMKNCINIFCKKDALRSKCC